MSMVAHDGDVREGMDVLGLDGVSLGTVGEVWIAESAEERPHDFASGMPDSGPEREGHFHVHRETDDLYVPFAAIVVLFPGQNVTIGCTADECRQRYGAKPVEITSERLVRA